MIHFIYLLVFSFFLSVVFAVFFDGSTKERVIYGVKTFLRFVLISLGLAWLLYFFSYA